MALSLSLWDIEAGWGLLLESWLIELALGFTFFSALAYSVLIHRFDHPRSVAAMAGSIGLALGSGLAAGARVGGWSVTDLGPAAAGIAMLVIVVVVYQAFMRFAGHVVAALAALLTALLILAMIGPFVPVARNLAATLMLLGMIAGLGWMVFRFGGNHRLKTPPLSPARVEADLAEVRDLRQHMQSMGRQIDELKSNSLWLEREPVLAEQVKRRLEQMLPEQGQLTRRLSHLRQMMHRARRGEVMQVKALEKAFKQLPADARAAAAKRLRRQCNEASLVRRLDRLDRAVAEAERRLKEVTTGIERALDERRFRDVSPLMDGAQKLQHQMQNLIVRIERTEHQLLQIVRQGASSRGE